MNHVNLDKRSTMGWDSLGLPISQGASVLIDADIALSNCNLPMFNQPCSLDLIIVVLLDIIDKERQISTIDDLEKSLWK